MSQFNLGWIPLIQQELRKFFASKGQGDKADTALQPGAIGSTVQGYNANLQAIAALNTNGVVARTGAGTAAIRATGATGLAVLASADEAAARTAIGAAPLASPTFTGTVTASAATASTSTTTGALVVTGGLGVGGALFAGGTVAAFPSANLLVGAASTSGPGDGNDLVSSAIVQEFSLAEPQACLKGNMSQPSGAVGGSIGTAQVIHWIKSLAVADTRSRLVIPFVAQGVQHQNTFVKIFAKCDRLNTSTNVVGFEATFIANHLDASITAIQSWGLNGNISTITTSGLSVRLNFSSAFPSGSTLVVYIQSMPYSNSRSIDFANVVVE